MEPKKAGLVLVDPNTAEARRVCSAILKSMEGMVPFNVLMGGIIRLFASTMLMAVDVAGEDDRERVRGHVLLLLGELTEVVQKWPNIPSHLLMRKSLADGKMN